jgi:hypothetical protein
MKSFIVLLFVCLLFHKAQSQTAKAIKDTVYILICRSTLDNGRPEPAYMVFKYINSLPSFSTYNDHKDAICALFKSSIFFEEPFFTIQKNKKRYRFSTKQESSSFFEKLTIKIEKLNHRYVTFHSKMFAGCKKVLQIECVKVIAVFWLIDAKTNDINSINHTIRVDDECYSQNYWYNLRDLEWSGKLNKDEINRIQKKIGR